MIKLVNVDSEQCYEMDGSRIFYRPMSPRDIDAVNSRFWRTRGGKASLDFGASKKEVLAKGVTRWEGVQDAKGAEVPFHADLLDFLPTEARDALYLAITGREPDAQEEEGANP